MASLLATPVSDWGAACATIITSGNITTGLVGQYGNPVPFFSNLTWGITKETCYQYCGKDKIYQFFDFNGFANAFLNWLLPWLALTAQLPFEARTPTGNLMSLFMGVGSPALITYSLTITILNRIWVRRIFESLMEQLDGLTDLPSLRSHRIRERLRAAQYLLQESQQVPMRASQVHGWLSSLVDLDKNHAWWMRVKKDLQNSRRGYTFSLVAQVGMALVAFIFTIAASLNASSVGTPQGSQVILTAGGGIWIWMIPVIWGWIMCGTQARAHSITEAVNDKTHPAFRIDERGKVLESVVQYGIRSRSGLVPRPRLLEIPPRIPSESVIAPQRRSGVVTESKTIYGSHLSAVVGGEISSEDDISCESNRNETHGDKSVDNKDEGYVTVLDITAPETSNKNLGDFLTEDYELLKFKPWLGFSIEGDEAREGPTFNYARLFTFREFSLTVTKAFIADLASFKSGENQKRNTVEVAEACRLDKDPLQAYTPWRRIDAIVWHHMLIAAGAAIFVQWGTTGPAIMMAYLTPTVGLGCRSGGHLIYGVAATVSWALFICSSLFSHAAALRYQDIYMGRRQYISRRKNSDTEDAGPSIEKIMTNQIALGSDHLDLSAHKRSLWHSILAFFAVTTRIAGKLIALANSCWIVVSAIFEYTGVYASCWCETDADVLGSRGWAAVFATSQSLTTVSRNFWVGGVIFSFGVCFLAFCGFFLGCKRSDDVGEDDN